MKQNNTKQNNSKKQLYTNKTKQRFLSSLQQPGCLLCFSVCGHHAFELHWLSESSDGMDLGTYWNETTVKHNNYTEKKTHKTKQNCCKQEKHDLMKETTEQHHV